MKKTKGHDYSTIIIWASILVGMVRYSAAFLSSDIGMITGALSETITILLGISGAAMGLLGTLGTAYIFDGWRQKMPASGVHWSNKFIALTLFVFAAFFCEVVIIVPFTVSRIRHESIAVILGNWDWLWSMAIVIMPILLIGGVSVGNQIVTVRSGNFPETFRTPGEAGKITPKDWRKIRPTLTDEQVKGIAIDQAKNIAFNFDIDERTARNWRKYAQLEIKPNKK